MNLLEDVEGSLPDDKEKMLNTIDYFLSMPQEEQESFITGRRIGRVRLLSEFQPSKELDSIRDDLKKIRQPR